MTNHSYVNYYERGNSFSKSLQALIGLTGIICNTLAICVFERKRLKKYSYSFYWKIMALFESLILLHTFRHWSRYFLHIDIDSIAFFCRFNEYQAYVTGTIVLGLESLITLDRFVTIVYPNRFAFVKQTRFQITAILLIATYSLLVNIHLPLNYRLYYESKMFICHVSSDICKLNWTIGLINMLIVNLVVNPILDLKIIFHIVSTRENIRPINRSTFIDRQFAISAIGLNVTSLLIKLPYLIGNLLSIYLNLESESIDMIFGICLSITLVEKTDSLFVNLLVNSTFRRELISMIGPSGSNTADFVKSNRNANNVRSGGAVEVVELLERRQMQPTS